jgi:large subunit ribosomal protein L18
MDKKQARLRRARKIRAKIAELRVARLTVYRSNCHIYAQVIAPSGDRVLAAASTLETDLRQSERGKGPAAVGRRIAEKAKSLGIETVAFDRAGYKFHGRVKQLAEAAREHGLKF